MAMATRKRKGDRHSDGYIDAFNKGNYEQIGFRVRKDSGIMDALNLACRMTGVSKAGYIRDAIVDRLIDDGYLEK